MEKRFFTSLIVATTVLLAGFYFITSYLTQKQTAQLEAAKLELEEKMIQQNKERLQVESQLSDSLSGIKDIMVTNYRERMLKEIHNSDF